jgi:hypothetical protein
MRKCVRIVSSIALGMIMSASFATAAIAQGYQDEPPLRYELASLQADFDGTFRYAFTAPDVVNENYYVFAVGTDKDGEPFEWPVGEVSPAHAGLTWTFAGYDLLPGSDFILEARYQPGTAITPEEIAALANAPTESDDDSEDSEDASSDDDIDVLGTVQTPDDDSSLPAVLIGGGILAAVLAGAGLYGMNMRSRHS